MVSLGCGRQGGKTGRTTQADDIALSVLGFVLGSGFTARVSKCV